MKNTRQQVNDLARFLDGQNQREKPIKVIGSRAHLLRTFKPKKRGGALFAGSHELIIVKRLKVSELITQELFAHNAL